jgi:hypothetical protein
MFLPLLDCGLANWRRQFATDRRQDVYNIDLPQLKYGGFRGASGTGLR